MQELLKNFKDIAIQKFQNPDFTFHEWFVDDHLLIVERIALELCDLYPEADREIVRALVWFHDFGKPINEESERDTTRHEGQRVMAEVGFDKSFIDVVVAHWERMEMKNEIDISKEAIEVQIISSADGASHFVGKFFATYFRDDPDKPITHAEKRLLAKIEKDWQRKIVLPEIRQAFEARYHYAKEKVGVYPTKFID